VLLSGVPGVSPGRVTILGGGVVGSNAALIAIGLGAEVTVIDRSLDRLRALHGQFGNRLRTLHLSEEAIESSVVEADLIIGAILVPGATTPRLLRREQLGKLRPGSVLVDVSIDQGGCFETSHPTTHADPTFVVDGIVHYCVANMPGAVARTSTFALSNATLPFILALADKGWRRALLDDPHLRNGLNIHQGKITCGAVAQVRGLAWTPAEKALEDGV
jgi:alanine dehydrogenase